MDSLIALSADYYWELDDQLRLTAFRAAEPQPCAGIASIAQGLGKTLCSLGTFIPVSTTLDALHAQIAQRDVFRKVLCKWKPDASNLHHVSVSGEPVFDRDGNFTGYRGVMQDVTELQQELKSLRRFRDAMDVSGDPIFLIDHETVQYVDFNEGALRASGYTREEMTTMGPHDLMNVPREFVKDDFDKVVAAAPQGLSLEVSGYGKGAKPLLFELQRRAVRDDDRWLIVTIARDITRRKQAEEAAVRIGRMYAAISGTNEAILMARSREELLQKVCDVAVQGGLINSATILFEDPDTGMARPVAGAGIGMDTIRAAQICFDDSRPEGRGLSGPAFRTQKANVINDLSADPRMQVWRNAVGRAGVQSGAALPIVRDNQSVGVLLLYAREKDVFDEGIVSMLERMAQNIAFALDHFDHETERKMAQEALRESEEKYRGILENMIDGYFEVDLDGTYTFVNDALCRIHRCSMEEALKLNYRDYTSADTASYIRKVFTHIYRTGEPADLTEYYVRRKDGTGCSIQVSVQLIVDGSGQPVGFRGVTRDVTALRLTQEALRASEEKYRSILDSIEESYYEVDLSGNVLLLNEAFGRLFGYTLSELIGYSYTNFHKTSEIAHLYSTFNEVFRTGIPKLGIDWKVQHKDGHEVWCEGSVQLVKDGRGEPVGFRGMLRDVTARRQMEDALRKSEERFRDLTELSSDWYWEQDYRYRFVQINGDVEGKTGLTAEDYIGKTLWELPFETAAIEDWTEHRNRVVAGKPFNELVLKTVCADGKPRYLSISGLPVRDARGRLKGYRGIGKDITERKEAEQRIHHLATHDILTGLPNRLMFNEMLAHEVEKGRRYQTRFALMFIDLDQFKDVNDSFGHDAGDMLLKETAKRLRDNVRSCDFVARLAGDEFVVIVQEPGEIDQLHAIADKIVHALRAPVMLGGRRHFVTASIGICAFPNDGVDEASLLKHADAAMYAVKRTTKNNFRVHAPTTAG